MRKVFIVITFIGILSSLSNLAVARNGNGDGHGHGHRHQFQNLQDQIDDNYTDIIDHEDRIQTLETSTGNIIYGT